MKSTIDEYLRHIESICGGQGQYFQISDLDEYPPITVISFNDVPEKDCTTAFSFGLSSNARKEWINSRPELVISVNSTDIAWPIAMGEIIRNGSPDCLFEYGSILRFGQKVADDSEMTSFLVFACTLLEEADLSVVLLDRKILFSQIYPIHDEEIILIKRIGPEKFVFQLGINLFDVKRKPYERDATKL